MTDLEKLQSLLTEFGAGFSQSRFPETGDCIRASIECQAKVNRKVVGYAGFSVDFSFDKDGKFIEIWVWECLTASRNHGSHRTETKKPNVNGATK